MAHVTLQGNYSSKTYRGEDYKLEALQEDPEAKDVFVHKLSPEESNVLATTRDANMKSFLSKLRDYATNPSSDRTFEPFLLPRCKSANLSVFHTHVPSPRFSAAISVPRRASTRASASARRCTCACSDLASSACKRTRSPR